MIKQRRGTAIVEMPEGILLAAMRNGKFLLPGGRAEKGESRFRAAIRELEEETGLVACYAKTIFQHESHSQRHLVVLIKAHGTPKPGCEIKHITFYQEGRKLRMSGGTKDILRKYFEWKRRPD
ncbi:MAG: NUDIX domain-containing protein [Candidatus Woesearchaeota archaeon]